MVLCHAKIIEEKHILCIQDFETILFTFAQLSSLFSNHELAIGSQGSNSQSCSSLGGQKGEHS